MKRLLVAVALAAAFTAAAGVTNAQAAGEAITWQPDLVHSRAEFTVAHLVLSKVWGHIPIRGMTIVTQKGSLVPEKIDALLDVSHEDTDNHQRDENLRSSSYFDVAQYPTLTFTSTHIVPKSDTDFDVTGNLTIKNVTKPVAFPVHVIGHVPDPNGLRVGYSAEMHIDRRDFGIADNSLVDGVLFVGYDVTIGLTAEAISDDPSLPRIK